jgi:hypothetical protein
MKDDSAPVQVRHAVTPAQPGGGLEALRRRVDSIPSGQEKIKATPKVGHKLHRLTTMTSKTPQFHLLAHGNPKPDNLLVSPLEQFELDVTPKKGETAEAAVVGTMDRAHIGVNN